jgi:phage gp36-like protein
MLIFLQIEEFKRHIKQDSLDRIIADDQGILYGSELAALEEMQSYLGVRYDNAIVFSRTGTDRNPLVVMRLIDIVLYHIHSRLNPSQVPQLRIDRYEMALEWLRMAAAGKLALNLPVKPGADGQPSPGGTISYQGETKRLNRF